MILSNSYGNSKNYSMITDNKGTVLLDINLYPGNYTVDTIFEGTDIYNATKITNTLTIKTNTTIISYDFEEGYGENKNFTITLIDMNNEVLANQTVIFTIINSLGQNSSYKKTTDENGKVNLLIELFQGNYTIKTLFNGSNSYGISETSNHLNITNPKIQSVLSSETFVENYGEGKNFTVTLTDINGTPLIGIELALKLINNLGDSKVYWSTTNTEGIAKLQINLIPSNYTIETSFYGNEIYSTTISNSSVLVNDINNTENTPNNQESSSLPTNNTENTPNKNKYNLTILNWGATGDITQNTVLMNNIESTELSNEIIEACNEGTPLIKFGNGNGPTIFINAGVHGNELASQAAAFKLINALNEINYEINGTIYIIPVLCPSSTAANTRYYNEINLNSVANQEGTLSNNLVNLALSLDADVLGDFHCTRVGGDPGKNVAMGTYSPQSESATLAKYISKRTGYAYLIYDVAGSEYPGAVEDVANLNGLTSVTCEALTNHGTIASGSVTVSYNMMTALLDYYSLLL